MGNLIPLFVGGNTVNLIIIGNILRALVAVEMLRVNHLEFVHNVFSLNGQITFVTELLRATFEVDIALLTERPA